MNMKTYFEKYTVALLVSLVVVIDLLVVISLTYIQTSYNYDFPEEAKIYELFSVPNAQGSSYYMNGAGDIEDADLKLTQLLSSNTVKKQNKFNSYVLLFTLGKNDFILYGKTVYESDIEKENRTSVKIYEKNDVVYAVCFKELEEPLHKEEVFCVYLVEDTNFSNEILKYKAVDNKYYVYSPSWVDDLMRFNSTGKIYIFIVVLEFIAVFGIFKSRKRTIRGRLA